MLREFLDQGIGYSKGQCLLAIHLSRPRTVDDLCIAVLDLGQDPREPSPAVAKPIQLLQALLHADDEHKSLDIVYAHAMAIEGDCEGVWNDSVPNCGVCGDHGCDLVVECGHYACKACLKAWVQAQCERGIVPPWIRCPVNCKSLLHPHNIRTSLDKHEINNLITTYLKKTVRGIQKFVPCCKKECVFGFIPRDDKPYQDICMMCGTSQTVKQLDPVKDDKSVQELVKQGKLRECPRCKELAWKDFGMCNVMHCPKCGVYWNWRTREMGESSDQLKQRARNNGTMWEPGELESQRKLERTDPEAFKQLLERNGIKYDPNYIRGT
jgi:hypothetical protein